MDGTLANASKTSAPKTIVVGLGGAIRQESNAKLGAAAAAIGTAATTTTRTLAKEIIANGSMVVAIFPAAPTTGTIAQAVAT